MKSLINRLAPVAPALIFPLYVICRKFKKTGIALLLFITISLSSCFLHFYRTNTVHEIDAATIQKLQSADKYFILHTGNDVFVLKNIKINNEILDGDLDSSALIAKRYIHPDTSRTNRFSIANKSDVLYTVHLYTSTTPAPGGHINFPLNTITRVDVYELDKAATSASRVASIIGFTFLAAAVIGLIAVAVSCNCPQVYTNNGTESKFNGGLYSGAIYASLERTDYMPLHNMQAEGNRLHLQIGNIAGEEQLINELKLLKVTHPKEDEALMDRYGNILVYHQPVSAEVASAGENIYVTSEVSKEDNIFYSFTNNASVQNNSDVILNFKKPVGASSAKLIVKAKNSGWSGYLFHEFNALFGTYYPAWTEKKDKADPKEMQQWQLDQSLPLMVSIKDGGNWKYIDYFVTPGNTAERDMIMKINLAGLAHADHVQIRLQTAYMFWDLNYAAMDFSEENNYSTTVLNPIRIQKSDSTSQIEQLSQKDKNYTQLINQDYIVADFEETPATPNQGTSYFLLSSGYYHINKFYDAKPQLTKLKGFLEKGAFDKFSRQKFEAFQHTPANDTTSGAAGGK
ncbi:MAG: hypothetical protein ABJB86_09435 [Bacteroidota bacterium]